MSRDNARVRSKSARSAAQAASATTLRAAALGRDLARGRGEFSDFHAVRFPLPSRACPEPVEGERTKERVTAGRPAALPDSAVLLHVPASRLFTMAPALADYLASTSLIPLPSRERIEERVKGRRQTPRTLLTRGRAAKGAAGEGVHHRKGAPQELWFRAEERLDNDAPPGRYTVWAVALEETGALARAQADIEVRLPEDAP